MAFSLRERNRQRRIESFKHSSDFELSVQEAMKTAASQSFCSPLEYASTRASYPGSRTRELTTWREVQERLQRSGVVATSPAAASTGEEKAHSAETQRFAVDLLTNVGPTSAAAKLNALAAEGRISVAVDVEGGSARLIYSVPVDAITPDLEPLRC